MGNKLGITEGEYNFINTKDWCEISTINPIISICAINKVVYEYEENGNLILDSFNTYNKCNKLPSQLLQEHEEMKAMLEKLAKTDEFDICDFIEIEQLLTKINQ